MTEGDVLLTSLVQKDGQVKRRPTLFLRRMPGFGDFLVCGISTQLQQRVPDFDEIIDLRDGDFAQSGLKAPSLYGLAFLRLFRNRISMVELDGSVESAMGGCLIGWLGTSA